MELPGLELASDPRFTFAALRLLPLVELEL